MPNIWEINSTNILHTEKESRIVIKIKPPISATEGVKKIPFEVKNGRGLVGGYGNISVNIPQYYGVSIAAQQIDSNIKILVTNTGNGKDTFKLSKELEEGLSLYLTETYFELEPYETKEINTQGLETVSSLIYEAYFSAESIGNTNVSANIILEIKGSPESKSDDNSNVFRNALLISGIVAISAFLFKIRRD